MLDFTARRYRGSADRLLSSRPSQPSASVDRAIAPRLAWSTMSSTTTSRRDLATSDSASYRSSRSNAASAPRCTWKPVSDSTTSASATYTVAVVADQTSRSASTQRGASRNDRGT